MSSTERDAFYMNRCLQLAALGLGAVAPNPMVGAVLVYNDKIIAEGYHQQYGGPHAEVNCFSNVKPEAEALVKESTLYVNLEPCCHFGKTPPCSSLVIAKGVKKVVIANLDVNPLVSGNGVAQLKAAGITVIAGVLAAAAQALNSRFFTYHQKKRPYLVLKWAQSADHFIGKENQRIKISNEVVDRLVHQWRSEEQAILVGTKTVIVDNPQLTNRYTAGRNPIRIVIDQFQKVPLTQRVFDQSATTLLINANTESTSNNVQMLKVDFENFIPNLMTKLYEHSIQSVLIEGGAFTLQQFLDSAYWDEIRVLENEKLFLTQGVAAPTLNRIATATEQYGSQHIKYYFNKEGV